MNGPADLPELWDALRKEGDGKARERIVAIHLPFARIVAARLYARRTYAELEFLDYLQYASIGLLEAVDRYDAGRGIGFRTFAMPRIAGAVLNGIGTLSERQEQISARLRIMGRRYDSLKRPTLENDGSMQCDGPKSGADPVFVRLAEMAIGLALGFVLEDSGMVQMAEPSYPDNTYQNVERLQLCRWISGLLAPLPRRQQCVIRYHYLQQLNFADIAGLLGMTKGRVSQIHREALAVLRAESGGAGRHDPQCYFL